MIDRIVVDTNVIFSVLLHRRSRARQILGTTQIKFYSPCFVVVELFKHKERIAAESELSDDESAVPIGIWSEARRLCAGVDEKDAPFVALALHLGAILWTDDAELRKGLRAQGFDQFFPIQ